ncbi:MAG: YigZ family protein [Defluviitaleaceae bacterium]|nr:YigZ family protein [Defluviitaleaceae bacterium]
MKPYLLPIRAAQADFVEKKSRFIGHISPVASEEEARTFLQSVREQHREANHNVYAYRLKENGIMRHSDDGEPGGTAGLPLLNVFLKQDIYDFCCVATRYFGGIHLGAGGLVRAYSRCGTIALNAAGVGAKRELALCAVSMAYGQYESVKRLLIASNASISDEAFGADVTLTFSLLSEGVDALQHALTEQTAATVQIIKLGVHYAVI